MSSERELDEAIKSIKSAWRRENTARANLEKMLEQAEAENAKLRELAKQMRICLTRPKIYDGEQPYLTATECPYFTEGACDYNACGFEQRMQELDIEVDK